MKRVRGEYGGKKGQEQPGWIRRITPFRVPSSRPGVVVIPDASAASGGLTRGKRGCRRGRAVEMRRSTGRHRGRFLLLGGGRHDRRPGYYARRCRIARPGPGARQPRMRGEIRWKRPAKSSYRRIADAGRDNRPTGHSGVNSCVRL